ncbi:MAG: nicotinate-nucleotide adenylyltransferase [Pirellulales bacterium]
MRIGIFGGSFDPIHYGHLLLAESCREQRQLDRVWFLPAAVPPHKRRAARAPDTHRANMIELALAEQPAFELSLLELKRGGLSYTADTLREIAREQPEAELFLLLGGDSLVDLPTWREPEEICRLAIPVVVSRPGAPPPDFSPLVGLVSDERLTQIEQSQVEMPLIELSSTDIRRRVAAGQSIRYRTLPSVMRYIEQLGLYRDAAEA